MISRRTLLIQTAGLGVLATAAAIGRRTREREGDTPPSLAGLVDPADEVDAQAEWEALYRDVAQVYGRPYAYALFAVIVDITRETPLGEEVELTAAEVLARIPPDVRAEGFAHFAARKRRQQAEGWHA